MEKREMKFYETPAVEVVEMEVLGILCASPDSNIDDVVIGDGPADEL